MFNRIRHIYIKTIRLDPTEAEVDIYIELDRVTQSTEIRGRMTGPHCAFANTVEVAYALLKSRQDEDDGVPAIGSRVIIPESNLWDPISPFLYQIAVELWQDGIVLEQKTIHYALRRFRLGPRGLICNGGALMLHGITREQGLDADALQLRQAGYNAILAPVASKSNGLWESADRLVLARVNSVQEKSRAYVLRDHLFCLAWLVTPEFLAQNLFYVAFEALAPTDGKIVGLELDKPLSKPLPDFISFVACDEGLMPSLAALRLPKLILRSDKSKWTPEAEARKTQPMILGWVE